MAQRIKRGIDRSFRVLESMLAVRLFLRARVVIKYLLRAASTLKNTDGEQRSLRKFSGRNQDLFLLKRNVLCQVIWLTPFNRSKQCTANCALLAMMSNYVRNLRVSFSAVHQVNSQRDNWVLSTGLIM